jgi:membrane protein required for colicin V production
MTAFDLAVIVIVGLSTLFAFWQGFIRMMASLVAWVIGIVAAIRLSGVVGTLLPDLGESVAVRYVLAFLLILVIVLIVGALVGSLVSRLAHAVGLGFVDRMLGAITGVARGILVALLLVLVAGVTALPRSDWWQNALWSPAFVAGALSLRPWLPKLWADNLDYGRRERPPGKSVVIAWCGERAGG